LILESQNGLTKRSGADGMETPVLRLANITAGSIDESDPREIRLTAKELAKYALQLGDLVCIRVNGSKALVGRVIQFRANRVWAYCDHFIRLRPNQALVDHRYLAHYFNSQTVRRHIELNMVSSAGQNTVSQGTMLDIPVPCPGLEVQREIVAELEKQFSRLDEAVANLQRVKANLKRYKASVLKAAVEGHLVETGGCWRQVKLGEVAMSVRNGYSHKPDAESGTRIFRISAVRPMELAADDVRYLSGSTADYDTFLAVAGDVLFTRYNGSRDYVGVCAQVPKGLPPTVYPDKLIRVRVPIDKLLPAFLVISASTGQGREFIESMIRTTAGQSGVSGSDIKAIPLSIPTMAEQTRIVAEVDRHLSIIREVEAEVDANLKRAQALRQSVLSITFQAIKETDQ
jgi:type I restriction enzyme S subunit